MFQKMVQISEELCESTQSRNNQTDPFLWPGDLKSQWITLAGDIPAGTGNPAVDNLEEWWALVNV